MRETIVRLLALVRYYIPMKYLTLSPTKPHVDIYSLCGVQITDAITGEEHFYNWEPEFEEDFHELAACFRDSCELGPPGEADWAVGPGNWPTTIILITLSFTLGNMASGFLQELGKDIYTESKEVLHRIINKLRKKSNQISATIPEGALPLTMVIRVDVHGVKLLRGLVISDKEDVFASALSSIQQIYFKYLKTGHACEYVYDPIKRAWESADVLREAMKKKWYRQPEEMQETIMHRRFLYRYYAHRLGRELS